MNQQHLMQVADMPASIQQVIDGVAKAIQIEDVDPNLLLNALVTMQALVIRSIDGLTADQQVQLLQRVAQAAQQQLFESASVH